MDSKGLDRLNPAAREAVLRIRKALEADERMRKRQIAHVMERVAPAVLRKGEDDIPGPARLAANVVALNDGICIKLTSFKSEPDLLTKLHAADPDHTVTVLFSVLGPKFEFMGYGMERFHISLHDMLAKIDREQIAEWLPQIRKQSRTALDRYHSAELVHSDIRTDNVGVRLDPYGSITLKIADPLFIRRMGEGCLPVSDAEVQRDETGLEIMLSTAERVARAQKE